jgi:glyceraldehyde 3-phosphate dehydrogenase
MKIAINGIGRIGRSLIRNLSNQKKININYINDLNNDFENIKYLINYDTTYGNLVNSYKLKNDYIINKFQKIKLSSFKNIEDFLEKNNSIDILIDCTGVNSQVVDDKIFHKYRLKHVIKSNCSNDLSLYEYLLPGISSAKKIKNTKFISAGICDSNALVPLFNILDKKYLIDFGYLTTIHPWLSYQNLLDGAAQSQSVPGHIYTDYVLGRSSVNNILPKKTSAIDAVKKFFPKIANNFSCMSYRVPTSIVSLADVMIKFKRKVLSKDEIIKILLDSEKKQKINLIKNNFEPKTSLDFKNEEYSSIIDHRWTLVLKDNLCKFVIWYDNESGYTSRIIDLIKILSK